MEILIVGVEKWKFDPRFDFSSTSSCYKKRSCYSMSKSWNTLVAFRSKFSSNERLIPANRYAACFDTLVRFGYVMYPEVLQTRDILSWTGARASCIDRIDFSLQNSPRSATSKQKYKIHRLCVSSRALVRSTWAKSYECLMNNDYAEGGIAVN